MTGHPRNTRVRVSCPEVSARLVEAAPAATSGCGKCHYWRPDGPWTAEHPLVLPRVAATALTGHLGLLRACSGSGAMRPAPAATSGCGKCHYWRPDGPWTAEHPLVVPGGGRDGAHGPSGASQGLSSVFWPRSREPVVVIAGNGPWTAGRSGPPVRHSGKAEGEKVLLSWGFSVTDPDSGTADLASTTAWVNDH